MGQEKQPNSEGRGRIRASLLTPRCQYGESGDDRSVASASALECRKEKDDLSMA